MDSLPDEMLQEIFEHLKFYGNLRSCLVCTRWLDIINRNIGFMRKVTCNISEQVILDEFTDENRAMSRKFRSVSFWGDDEVTLQHNYKIQQFKYVEKVEFHNCVFKDLAEFEATISFYEKANFFKFDSIWIGKDTEQNSGAAKACINRPVKCILYQTNWKALQYFENIYHLEITGSKCSHSFEDNELPLDPSDIIGILLKYTAALKTLDLLYETKEHCNKVLSMLANCTNLELNICSLRFYAADWDLNMLQQFFFRQQQNITTLKLLVLSITVMNLEFICLHLPNLEKFQFAITEATATQIAGHLNKLRALPKLSTLDISFYGTFDEEIKMDELALTDLNILFGAPAELKMFKTSLPNVKKLTVQCLRNSRLPMDNIAFQEALNCFISLVPNLESLTVENSDDEVDSVERICLKIDNSIKLKSITLSCKFFAEDNLCTLKLPDLIILRLCNMMIGTTYYNKFQRSGLTNLAKNCPKLLTIDVHDSSRITQLIARRASDQHLFKVMKPLPKNWELECYDYDSRDSCSDEEEQ